MENSRFIIKGKRLEQQSEMRDDLYSLISDCWKQEPYERLEITQIISKLQEIFNRTTEFNLIS